MRPHRATSRHALATVVVSLVAALVAGLSPPDSASAAPRRSMLLLDPTVRGRDSLRVLGEGSQLRFTTDGTRPTGVQVVDPAAPERFIVTLDEPRSAASFAERVRERAALTAGFQASLARAHPRQFGLSGAEGVRVVRAFDRLLAACVVEAPADWRDRLRALPGVRSVSRSARVTTQLDQSVAQVRADLVQQSLGGTGHGVRVGIIDTGIDYTHPALGAGFGPGHRVAGGWDFVNGDADPWDDHGHGTHVAGIVGANASDLRGMAPEVTFVAYKVLNQDGGGYSEDVIAALERAADPDQDPNTPDQLDVVNLSLGGGASEEDDPAERAVNALDSLGVTVVCAAGNSGWAFTIGSPGTAKRAITVGATARADTVIYFSSRGPTLRLGLKPDLVAPGDNIRSAWPGGGTTWLSGTSMATPHVTGAVALLRQLHPEWSHADLRSAIVGSAVHLNTRPHTQGAGRLDAYAAATATFSVTPTSLSFGRRPPGPGAATFAETLRVHSRSSATRSLSLAVETGLLPQGVQVSVAPNLLTLPPGGEGEAVVTLALEPGHAASREPPFDYSGVVSVRDGSETRRVPFALHECLRLDLTAGGYRDAGVVIGDGRAWPGAGPFASTWYLPIGTYDALGFAPPWFGTPFFGRTDIVLAEDTVVDLGLPSATADVTWELRDEAGGPYAYKRLALLLLHESGAGIGHLNFDANGAVRLPVMKGSYRLEWSTADETGDLRYDIPGALPGPLASQTVHNDPAALRRLVEHVAVATTDSVLTLNFDLITSGDSYFGFAGLDPFTVPRGQSFDIVRWTAPAPFPSHHRFGHVQWLLNPAKARAREPNPFSGLGAVWQKNRADTLYVRPPVGGGSPVAAYTGRDLPLGSGPASFRGGIQMGGNGVSAYGTDWYTSRMFRDAVGGVSPGPPVEYELLDNGQTVESGVVTDEDRIFMSGWWSRGTPTFGLWELALHSRGWRVAGTPSETTVRTRLDSSGYGTWYGPESFAVVAGGAPREEITFGQDRDPHVEILLLQPPSDDVLSLEFRRSGAPAWVPLPLERTGLRARARLVPVEGDVALRLRIGASNGSLPLEMEIAPAFRGRRSPAANAVVLGARADASGAHVEWRVEAPGATLLLDRKDPDGDWREHGEVQVAGDGIVRYHDPAVLPGARYGYRLVGSTAEVFVHIPTGGSGFALVVTPNPSPRNVVVALTLDRESSVTLTLLDIQGRIVATRRLESAEPGEHVVNLTERAGIHAGLYFVRVERGAERLTRRVTLIP